MTDDAVRRRTSRTFRDLVLAPAEGEHRHEVAAADTVVGTREDLSFSGIKTACSHCGVDVYTSRRYPPGLEIICEVCLFQLYKVDVESGEDTGR